MFFADGARGEAGALRRTIDLARECDASLTVMDVVARYSTVDRDVSASIEQLQQALIDERRGVLAGLVGQPAGVEVEIRVVPGEKEFVEIIRAVAHEKYDLLIKSVNPRGPISTALFGNIDLRLLRQCPCPVWLMKPSRRKTLSRVLAAIDVTREERTTMQLANRIMELATSISTIEGAHLDVLAVFEDQIDPKMATRSGAARLKEVNKAHKEEMHHRFDRVIGKFRSFTVKEHVKQGKPEEVIQRFVRDQDVDLLIMGTLSRTGIPGLLIGNTAERVLDDVDCSVLTLKPKGFKTLIAS